MKLYVLGRSSGHPGKGGACSGYLIKSGRDHLLMDAGPGVLSRLLGVCQLSELNGIWISHLHADHFLDLFPLAYALLERCLTTELSKTLLRIPIFVPNGSRKIIRSLSVALSHPSFIFPDVPGAAPIYDDFRKLLQENDDFMFALLPCHEYGLHDILNLGKFQLEFAPVAHRIPASAVRVTVDRQIFVYSGDTKPCQALIDLAYGADVMLCEATNTAENAAFYQHHMSPSEAGMIATEAGVKSLLLTHLVPGRKEEQAISEAQKTFSGLIAVAREGEIYELSQLMSKV